MQNMSNNGQLRQVLSNSGGLIRSTLVSGATALAVLTIVYLPAEYGRDPTGFGALLGLTEMGQIKQQLYAEDAADAASAPVVLDPAVMARLDAIEAQLASINAALAGGLRLLLKLRQLLRLRQKHLPQSLLRQTPLRVSSGAMRAITL